VHAHLPFRGIAQLGRREHHATSLLPPRRAFPAPHRILAPACRRTSWYRGWLPTTTPPPAVHHPRDLLQLVRPCRITAPSSKLPAGYAFVQPYGVACCVGGATGAAATRGWVAILFACRLLPYYSWHLPPNRVTLPLSATVVHACNYRPRSMPFPSHAHTCHTTSFPSTLCFVCLTHAQLPTITLPWITFFVTVFTYPKERKKERQPERQPEYVLT